MTMDSYHVGPTADSLPIYSSYHLKNYSNTSLAFTMSLSGNSGQQGGDNYLARDVGTFHTPSFGDEDFDLPPLSLPSEQSSVNPQTVSQRTFSHQPMGNLDLSLNQPMTIASNMQTTDCSVLTTLSGPHPVVPQFPPQNFEVPDITVTNSVIPSASNMNSIFSNVSMTTNMYQGGIPQGQMMMEEQRPLSTISHSQMANQLGFQSAMKQSSPVGSNSTSSPSRESSEDSDDSLPLAQLMSLKRAAAATASVPEMPAVVTCVTTTPVTTTTPATTKKQKTPKKKKKRDPNEPQKPVSAYALFFRDTQAAIKGQNPNASFGEVSKIVASMWDGLDPDHKNVYKKKTEVAKKEYLKQLAAYRASQVSQAAVEEAGSLSEKSPSPPNVHAPMGGMQQGVGKSLNMMSRMGNIQPQQQSVMSDFNQSQVMLQNIAPRQPMAVQQNNGMTYQQSPVIDQTMMQLDGRINAGGMCVRNGCSNQAIESPGWDSEYCSNECVVSHCRDVFTAWVASRQGSNSFANAFPVK